MKRIEETTKKLKPARRVEVIRLHDGETEEEALAKRPDLDPEDPDLLLIIIQGVKPGDPGTRPRSE
jgi:hypothetical protein